MMLAFYLSVIQDMVRVCLDGRCDSGDMLIDCYFLLPSLPNG